MGQFGNQPDFATNDIKVIVPSDTIDRTTFLDASVVYIGDNTTLGNELKVIPAGVAGPFIVNGLNALNNGGTQYTDNNNLSTTTTGNGTGLTVDITTSAEAIQNILTITINTAGTGYENGDFIEVVESGQGGINQARYSVQVSAGLPTVAQAIEFKNVPQGEWFPVAVDYVLADLTTVTGIIAGK